MSRKTLPSILTAILVAALAGAGSSVAWGAEPSQGETKSDSLKFLQDLRNQNVNQLRSIDKSLADKVESGKAATLVNEVHVLRDQKREHMMRQEFLDRLIFQIDTKFGGGDLRAFLENALTDMAKVDALTASNDTHLWKFMRYAADAVKRIPERRENILAFLEGYMNRSISNPVTPEDYLSTRNYSNGAQSASGNPIPKEEVGVIADRRLQEMNAEKPVRNSKPR